MSRQPQHQGVRQVTVGEGSAGQRLDNFLLKQLPGVPKSHVYRLVRSGQVRVDGGRARPDRRLNEGEAVRIPPVRVAERDEPIRAPDGFLRRLREAVIHEDADYCALNKPAGMAVHGGSGVAYGVIEAVRGEGRFDFVELCHRLDRDTSGVLLLAKNRTALLRAQAAFRDGLAQKRYWALLCGRWVGGDREVDDRLLKGRLLSGERFVSAVEEGGKAARSIFMPRERYRDAVLCEVAIESGRMHQIRVHAASIEHPVAGDRKYASRDQWLTVREAGLKRMFLHAHSLDLPADGTLPRLIISAPIPDELDQVLRGLATNSSSKKPSHR